MGSAEVELLQQSLIEQDLRKQDLREERKKSGREANGKVIASYLDESDLPPMGDDDEEMGIDEEEA